MAECEDDSFIRFPRRTRQIEFTAKVGSKAAAWKRTDPPQTREAICHQCDEAVHSRWIVARRLALDEFLYKLDDFGLLRSRKSKDGMHRCYNSQIACPSWTRSRFATSF